MCVSMCASERVCWCVCMLCVCVHAHLVHAEVCSDIGLLVAGLVLELGEAAACGDESAAQNGARHLAERLAKKQRKKRE